MGINDVNLSTFLMKSNEECSIDEFIYNFYRTMTISQAPYSDGQYDTMLEQLYYLELSEYKQFYMIFKKINLKFIKDNYSLIMEIIANGDPNKLQIAIDMYKKTGSITSRLITASANYTSITEEKEKLIAELNELLDRVTRDGEDNLVDEAKVELAKFYGQYRDDDLLKDLYIYLEESLEPQLIAKINEQMCKIEPLSLKFADGHGHEYAYRHNVDHVTIQPLAPYISGGRKK